MNKKEAANFLGVTERTINNYINKGYLLTDIKLRGFVNDESVKQFKRILESPIPLNKLSFTKLLMTVERQERELAVIKRILNIYDDPLNLPDNAILSIYNMADITKLKSWPEDWELDWADYLNRITDKDLQQIEKLTGELHPWIRFYKLCVALEELKLPVEINNLYIRARNRFIQLANVWVTVRGNTEVLKVLHKHPFSDSVVATLLASEKSK